MSWSPYSMFCFTRRGLTELYPSKGSQNDVVNDLSLIQKIN